MATMHGDHPTARSWLEQGMSLAGELGMQRYVAQALTYLSFIAQGQHDGDLAYTYLQQALAIGRQLGDKNMIAENLLFLGFLKCDKHDYMTAQALYEESLAIFQELGTPFGIADALSFLGKVAQYQNDYQRARTLYRESLAGLQAFGLFQWQAVALCLAGLADICAIQQQVVETARLFGAAEALREFLGDPPQSVARKSAEDKLAALHLQLDEAAFVAAWAEGRAFTAEQAIEYALALPDLSTSAPSPVLPPSVNYPAGLTTREVEVLRLLAQGLTYAQIAEKLIVTRRTVNGHVTSIYSKLGVNRRTAATRFAVEHRLV